jgi:4-oxalocrotonate tautomerase
MISGQEGPVLAKKLAKEISRLTKDILGKKQELTVVTMSFLEDRLWFID